MGGSKRALMEWEDQVSGVILRLTRAGAVSDCEFHGYSVDEDESEAVDEVKQKLMAEVGKDEAERLVEAAMSNLYLECPGCAKNARE